jgi:hypothetical protein
LSALWNGSISLNEHERRKFSESKLFHKHAVWIGEREKLIGEWSKEFFGIGFR